MKSWPLARWRVVNSPTWLMYWRAILAILMVLQYSYRIAYVDPAGELIAILWNATEFECPYCAMARPVLEGLVVGFPDAVQLVFRHFPVTTTHPHAFIAAEAAEAAGAQGKFCEVRQDFRRGILDSVNGTPTIFINRQRYDGPRDQQSMLAAIQALMPAWR